MHFSSTCFFSICYNPLDFSSEFPFYPSISQSKQPQEAVTFDCRWPKQKTGCCTESSVRPNVGLEVNHFYFQVSVPNLQNFSETNLLVFPGDVSFWLWLFKTCSLSHVNPAQSQSLRNSHTF